MRIQLTPVNGGRPIELERELTLVGRQDECDLKLEDKSVSKLHCVLFCDGRQVMVRDLGSTNGTRVNGQRIRRSNLTTDDQLSVAGCVFRVTLIDDPRPEKPRQPIPSGPLNQTVRIDPHVRGKPDLRPASTSDDDDSDSVEIQPHGENKNPLPDIYPD